jgi:hypothetical protein
MKLQESRAVIAWTDGSMCWTEWLPDDGSQKAADRMMDAMVMILNERFGQKCAIKWEQRELTQGNCEYSVDAGDQIACC